ncbi:MAG: SPOR domain-containing protein [Gammaproteobacteria bacterium]|nr:SPOR domain-containing protein [Gammaproteobacteria bacterium]MDH5734491.1 SPOR domain-containing protein [Gammaproteobacteria bacterium]
MTPYVIDKQKQLTIYLLFILGIIVSFGLGFVFGYQASNMESLIWPPPIVEQQSTESEAVTDEQGEENKAEDDTIKQEDKNPVEEKKSAKEVNDKQAEEARKVSQSREPEKKIVKSSPKPVEPVKKISVANQQQSKIPVKTSSISTSKPTPEPVQQVTQVVSPKITTPALANSIRTDESDISRVTEQSQTEKAQSKADVVDVTTKSSETAKSYYSVQAGLFASRDNAVKFLDELMGNGFDAYLIDFVSTSGDVKYNVRFGRSDDRNTTKQRLEEFRQAFSSPAYIVIDN